MKLLAFSMFDTAAGYYDRPLVCRSEAEAKRMLVDIVQEGSHQIAKHPDCFTLMHVGVWDDNTGHFDPIAPTKVMTALEAQSVVNNQGTRSLPDLPDNYGGTD